MISGALEVERRGPCHLLFLSRALIPERKKDSCVTPTSCTENNTLSTAIKEADGTAGDKSSISLLGRYKKGIMESFIRPFIDKVLLSVRMCSSGPVRGCLATTRAPQHQHQHHKHKTPSTTQSRFYLRTNYTPT